MIAQTSPAPGLAGRRLRGPVAVRDTRLVVVERYICIHGHFYQPPRENPWLEAIELQDSAYPYHDWNERITAECYGPNAASRILDGEQRIVQIVNNYAKISFNFGPTLLAWMEARAPEVYQAVLEADRESRRRYSGHGSALAQAYNHMILPLATRRDKRTQVLWGIRDFEHRFGRFPEGMWLPETAVDLETLDILAQCGIRFTILSPHQASKVRAIGARAWRDVSGGRVDPSMAYRVQLPSNRQLSVFFYDGPISRAVAFENLLVKGEYLAERLLHAFSSARHWPQIVHIATDGETYGHHRRHADMALAYALDYIETHQLARLTNYAEYLERHPPTHQVQITENTSWSCAHGVERWRSDCGCNSGMHPGWNQQWRGPLREALDWLRDTLAPCFERAAARLLRDPWAARDDYISLILDRSRDNVSRFFRRHAGRELTPAERVEALKLLELQRHAMLMYTSCGWFFDELSGMETVQVIQYAARVVQLAQELFGDSVEEELLRRLQHARSNLAEHGDGRRIYETLARPALVDLRKVGAHYAVSSLFETYNHRTQTYCYTVEREDYRLLTQGKARLALGRATVTSDITEESLRITFGVLHLGDHNVSGGVREFQGDQAYARLAEELSEVFRRGDLPEVIRGLDREFGGGTYSLRLLFRDEQRKILRQIIESALEQAEALYRGFYHDHAALMRFMTALGVPLPNRFEIAAEVTVNTDLRRAFESEEPDLDRIRSLLDEAKAAGVRLDHASLEFALRKTLERFSGAFRSRPEDASQLARLSELTALARTLPFEVNLWRVQNDFYAVLENRYGAMAARARQGDPEAHQWLELFRELGERLTVRVDPPATAARNGPPAGAAV
jgi:alpha-amylase/alpha-mannosidase (GH57 family)